MSLMRKSTTLSQRMRLGRICFGVAVLFVIGAGVMVYIRFGHVGDVMRISSAESSATSTDEYADILHPVLSPTVGEERVRMPDGTWGTLMHLIAVPLAQLPFGLTLSAPTTTPQPHFEPDMTLDASTYQLLAITGDNPSIIGNGMVLVVKEDGVHAEYVMNSEITDDRVSYGAPQLVAGGVRFEDAYGTDRLFTLSDRGVVPGITDPRTLHFIGTNGRYLADSAQVYYLSSTPGKIVWDSASFAIAPIIGADPETFEIVAEPQLLAMDAHAYYLNGDPVPGLNPTSAHIVKTGPITLIENAQTVYRFEQNYDSSYGGARGVLTEHARKNLYIKKVEEVQSQYSKDAYLVRYAGKPIAGADVHSFVVLVGVLPLLTPEFTSLSYDYARDKTRVYYQGMPVVRADPATFQPLDTDLNAQSYGRDIQRVFYHEREIVSADPQSFVPLWTISTHGGCVLSPYAKDVHAIYFEEKKVAGADPETFESLINGYGRDVRGIYFNGVFMPDVSPTFEPQCDYGAAVHELAV